MAGLLGKDTHDMPLEVCMWFGPMAEFAIERLAARRLTKAKALAVLKDAEEAGLVDTSRNVADQVDFICNGIIGDVVDFVE